MRTFLSMQCSYDLATSSLHVHCGWTILHERYVLTSTGLNLEIRTFSISFQMPLGTKTPYRAINADIHSTRCSFAQETGRCALLQLGDILQTLPEVYMLLIVLGGDETRARLHTLCNFFRTSERLESTSEIYPNFLFQFHSLLSCHATGSSILSWYLHNAWHSKIHKFISKTHPSYHNNFQDLLEDYMVFLL